MTAIRATFHKILPVPSRGQYQFVFEIPEEDAQRALDALGGLPVAGVTRWVGIAMLMPEGDQSASPEADAGHAAGGSESGHSPAPAPSEAVAGGAPKQRRHFSELPRSAQAAMLCENPVFQRWVCKQVPTYTVYGTDEVVIAAQLIRHLCRVTSRQELDNYPEHGKIWDALRARYLAETGQMAEQRT